MTPKSRKRLFNIDNICQIIHRVHSHFPSHLHPQLDIKFFDFSTQRSTTEANPWQRYSYPWMISVSFLMFDVQMLKKLTCKFWMFYYLHVTLLVNMYCFVNWTVDKFQNSMWSMKLKFFRSLLLLFRPGCPLIRCCFALKWCFFYILWSLCIYEY